MFLSYNKQYGVALAQRNEHYTTNTKNKEQDLIYCFSTIYMGIYRL